jgi:hypothetical protein
LNFKDVGAAVVAKCSLTLGGLFMAKNFEKLIFGGLHEKHAVQRGIWVRLLFKTQLNLLLGRTSKETCLRYESNRLILSIGL